MISFGHALPYDLKGPSPDGPHRNQESDLVLAARGPLGYRKANTPWFLQGFTLERMFFQQPDTFQLSKSGLLRDGWMLTHCCSTVNMQRSPYIPSPERAGLYGDTW